MPFSFTTVVLAASVLCLLAWAMRRRNKTSAIYSRGITIWRGWLPVLLTIVLLGVLASTLLFEEFIAGFPLSLMPYFSFEETFVLLLIVPFFVTRLGSLLAAMTLFYVAQSLILSAAPDAKLGLYILLSTATAVALLGDKIPWLTRQQPYYFMQNVREILLTVLAVAAFTVALVGIVKIYSFSRWLHYIRIDLPIAASVALLIGVLFGWLLIILGFMRRLLLAVLSVPTLLVVAFISNWSPTLLVIPFSACLVLSLAATEHRQEIGRRRSAFSIF